MFHSLFPCIFVVLVGEDVYSHLISASLFINLRPAWIVFSFFLLGHTPCNSQNLNPACCCFC